MSRGVRRVQKRRAQSGVAGACSQKREAGGDEGEPTVGGGGKRGRRGCVGRVNATLRVTGSVRECGCVYGAQPPPGVSLLRRSSRSRATPCCSTAQLPIAATTTRLRHDTKDGHTSPYRDTTPRTRRFSRPYFGSSFTRARGGSSRCPHGSVPIRSSGSRDDAVGELTPASPTGPRDLCALDEPPSEEGKLSQVLEAA